jgi:hypothetical protein
MVSTDSARGAEESRLTWAIKFGTLSDTFLQSASFYCSPRWRSTAGTYGLVAIFFQGVDGGRATIGAPVNRPGQHGSTTAT